MSEFLAEAAVLIRPDTSKFRATLVAELEAATRGLVLPVSVVAASGARNVATASRQAAVANREATATTTELNAARAKQAVTDSAAAASEERLAQAERLTAAASAKTALVQKAGASTTTELAAARAQLRAADAAIVAGERAVDASMVKGAEAAQANAVETLRLAVAQREQAKAAELAAIANGENAAAQAAAATKAEQLSRGFEATALSAFGVRGATLAASSSFLIGAAAVTLAKKSLDEYSAEQEAAARATKVFGAAERGLADDAQGFAEKFGLSIEQTLQFEGAIGNTLRVSGLARAEIPKLSEKIVELGADMAAFNNVSIDKTLASIQLALVGNSRGLRRFGVELNQAAVNEEALRLSGKRHTDELTRQDRVQARINLLFAQTANQQGAAAARSGELAQETRVLKAELANLGSDIGRLLIPSITDAVQSVTLLFSTFEKGKHTIEDLLPATKDAAGHSTIFGKALHIVARAERDATFPALGLKDAYDLLSKAFHHNSDEAQHTKQSTFDLNAELEHIQATITHALAAAARFDLRETNKQLGGFAENLVDVKIAGGDAAAQIAVLDRAISTAKRAVRDADTLVTLRAGTPGEGTAVANRRKQKSQLLDLLEQRRQLVQQQSEAAKNLAEQITQIAQDAAQKVKDLLDQADQAFLDALDLRQGSAQLGTIRAQRTKSLVDDVAAQQQVRAVIVRAISEAKHSISNALLLQQTLLSLQTDLANVNTTIADLQHQQAVNAAERRRAKFESQAESIDLDIELAQTNKNIRGEIAARQRRIALDEQRMKSIHGSIVATKKLRNDIAAQRAAIADLKKQLGERNKDLRALEFEFLQTQSGFAANLLSNLLPGGAVAGTVAGKVGGAGGGAIVTPTGPSGGGGGGLIDLGPSTPPDVRDVASGLKTDRSTAGGPPGASSGQMNTLIHVQRQMLLVLTRLAGKSTHPEAVASAAAQSVSMDFF